MRHARTRLVSPCGQIIDGLSIGNRPADVADRAIPGHWQGDLITGSQNMHMAALVERQSCFPCR
jgi:IS30 family transposase